MSKKKGSRPGIKESIKRSIGNISDSNVHKGPPKPLRQEVRPNDPIPKKPPKKKR